MSVAEGAAREVKGAVAKTVLSYVRRVLGDDAVARVLAAAGDHLTAAGIAEAASWTSAASTIAIADAAAELCGDLDIGRRAGEELMRITRERGTVDFVLATGSVAAALEMTTNAGTKMSSGRVLEVAEVRDGQATIVGTYLDPAYAHPFFCGHSAGYFGAVPEVFGFTSVIAEVECMCRGDHRCVYTVRWGSDAGSRPTETEDDVAVSRERVDSIIDRFEKLQIMASELAKAEQVDVLLARIAEQAGLAVDAPRYLLAVRTASESEARVHHRGFDEDGAARFAARLLAGDIEHDGRCLVAEVASERAHYGRIAALYPRGSKVTEMEHRLLAAYARHAAAALEAVASLEAARRDRDTAEALLGLSHALAEVGSPDEVAYRLSAAVPKVTGCQQAGVWLWDAAGRFMRLAAKFPEKGVAVSDAPLLRAGQVAGLEDLVRNAAPSVIRREAVVPVVRTLMEADHLEVCALVPIEARGDFFGIVVAGFEDAEAGAEAEGQAMVEILGGMASQAATAFDNARLLEHVRAQALHDSLTGLPNRRLLEDRARQALRQDARDGEATSVLFVDLDRMKEVNDSLGHEAGDELIRQSARRIGACLRSSDTLARLGGDEFVVLLPRTDDDRGPAIVADKIVAALSRPFDLGGTPVSVSASVGVASAPGDGGDYETLIKRADEAMYHAKNEGGGAYCLFQATPATAT